MDIGPVLRAMLRHKFRFGLIATQIAVTLAIIANCLTLIAAARRKMSLPSAFDDEHLIHVILNPPEPELRDDDLRDGWLRAAIEQLRAIPGVVAVSNSGFWAVGAAADWAHKPAGSSAEPVGAVNLNADERFLEVAGGEIDEGRWFTRQDVETTTTLLRDIARRTRNRGADGKALEPIEIPVVISRAYGRLLFGDGPLVGKLIEDSDGDTGRIVGILKRYNQPTTTLNHEDYVVIAPVIQHNFYAAGVLVRAAPGKTAAVASMIEERLVSVGDISAQFKRAFPVSWERAQFYKTERMTVALVALLVSLLLLVAALAVAGLTSFSVTERTRQIGVRRALGATTGDILRHFLMESGLLTTLGLFLGAGLAVLLNMALLRVYTDAKLGAGAVALGALVLWIVGVGSSLPPALRGARISPAIATRNL